MEFQIKAQKPLKELVYLELKHRILTGDIESQTRLMEIDLAEKMNVSRTPIREAIARLAEDGLVQIEPRRGAYVSNISIKGMLDVFEARQDIEGFIAFLAAERITEIQRADLRKLANEYEAATKQGDKERIIALDEGFHNFIVSCCDNDTLAELVHYIQELSLRFRYLYYDNYEMYEEMANQHNQIMEAIISGDGENARAVANNHVKTLKEFIFNLGEKMREEELQNEGQNK